MERDPIDTELDRLRSENAKFRGLLKRIRNDLESNADLLGELGYFTRARGGMWMVSDIDAALRD